MLNFSKVKSDEGAVMEIVEITNPLKLKDELLNFVFRVYKGTNGAYPALEWVDEKPSTEDFEGFRRVYEPFLEFRLSKEFDELYVGMERGIIIGTIALVYTLEGKDVWWVPEGIKNGRTGLIEFFMVDPDYKGRGVWLKTPRFCLRQVEGA